MKLKLIVALLSFLIQWNINAQAPAWQWAKSEEPTQFGGSSNSTCVDGNGNVYITGSFQGPLFTIGAITLTCDVNSIGFFIAKYNSSGNLIWAKSADGSAEDYGTGLAVDASGNVFVTGYFGSSTITFGSTTLTNASGLTYDFFIVKYDASGNALWARSAGGSNNDVGRGISVDANGNAFVTGSFNSTSISFGSTTLTLINPGNFSNPNNMFIAKYDAQGNVLWAHHAESTMGASISVDAGGNAFVAGVQQYTTTFGSTVLSDKDIYIAKYDASGSVLWAKSMETQPYYLVISYANFFNIAVCADVSGGAFLTGTFRDSMAIGNVMLTSAGGYDAYLAKYDGAGNVLWANRFGGTKNDYGLGVGTDVGGSVFVTGGYASPSLVIGNTTLTNTGPVYLYTPPVGPSVYTYTSDVFVAKYDPWGNSIWAKKASSSSLDDVNGISVGAGGEVIVTGNFYDSVMVFSGNPSLTITATNTGYSHIFIAKLQDNATGIKKAAVSRSFKIFPNPFSTEMILRSEAPFDHLTLTLENALGQTVRQINDVSGQELTVQRGQLPAGIYLLRLQQGGELLATKKLIIAD